MISTKISLLLASLASGLVYGLPSPTQTDATIRLRDTSDSGFNVYCDGTPIVITDAIQAGQNLQPYCGVGSTGNEAATSNNVIAFWCDWEGSASCTEDGALTLQLLILNQCGAVVGRATPLVGGSIADSPLGRMGNDQRWGRNVRHYRLDVARLV